MAETSRNAFMAREDDYKGFSIDVSMTSLGGGTYSPAIFHVYRNRGEQREPVHTGVVWERFTTSKDAARAAYAAARAWIDKHGEQ
jgi:hypothetical protein